MRQVYDPEEYMSTAGGLDPPVYHDTYPKPKIESLELKVLDLLCTQGGSHSSVVLTCDLYGTTEEVEESRTLEWTFVEQILDDLNKNGLVTYRLGQFEVFVHIRPTRKAYALLRMDRRWIAVVGPAFQQHPQSEQPLRPGDTTDFRGYAFSAEGMGPIIHEDFIDHCVNCTADHLDRHRDQLKEMYGSDDL